jgi:hypothetical protein
MKTHPCEADLALLAGGEVNAVSRFLLNRHVRRCETCLDTVAEFALLRNNVAQEIPDLDWERLEAEMRANIHLGLEAGECVREVSRKPGWNPRLGVAFASLLLLLTAGFLMRVPPVVDPPVDRAPGFSVLESSGSGLEFRSGASSLTLSNHHGSVTDQRASAQGVIGASYIDAGGVTINNVYLE